MARKRTPWRHLPTALAGLALAAAPGVAFAGGLVAAHPYADGSPVDRWAREMVQCVDSALGIPFDLLPGGAIGRTADVHEAVVNGHLDLAFLPAIAIAKDWPGLRLLVSPGAITSPRQALQLSEGTALLQALDESGGNENGVRVAAIGWQYQVVAKRLGTGDQFDGMKIRASPTHTDFFSKLGATTIVLPLSEVLFAMNVGVIDGAVLGTTYVADLRSFGKGEPLTLMWSDEFTPLVTPIVVVMGAFSLKNWGEKLLYILREECAEATRVFNERALDEARAAVRAAQDSGFEVVDYDEAEWASVAEAFFEEAADRSEDAYDVAAILDQAR